MNIKRGAFIVIEGCDRSGKTTQSRILAKMLRSKDVDIKQINFPDRTTVIGGVIDAHLRNKQDLNDEVIHLLFSANRWEWQNSIKKYLLAGTTVICDRYSYSGAAYSVAKGLDFDWCCAPDRGLVKPDAVFFLKANPNELISRGSYGEERYEKLDFQRKVGEVFDRLCAQSSYWYLFDACQSQHELQDQIFAIADKVLQQAAVQPLSKIK